MAPENYDEKRETAIYELMKAAERDSIVYACVVLEAHATILEQHFTDRPEMLQRAVTLRRAVEIMKMF